VDEDEWVETRLAEAPELTQEQIAHLRRLLGGGHAQYTSETKDEAMPSVPSRPLEDQQKPA
jgi:hypothetical protein